MDIVMGASLSRKPSLEDIHPTVFSQDSSCDPVGHCGLPGGKEPSVSAGDVRDLGSIPGLGRSPAGENGNPCQCSYLENPMDRGAWQATVHGVTESQT